ncbi:MAG: carboxymuconolactone decarboxylase family protein [Steroidobacteraceae bacterium]
MARVTGVYKPTDYPGVPDAATTGDLKEFFELMFPGGAKPEFDAGHSGWAVMAQNPRLAIHMARLTTYIARDMPWCKRRDLRELLIQTVNLHFKCESSFRARFPHAVAAGISSELQAAIPYWRTTSLFSAEQRLTIEYTFAAAAGDVPDELFQSVVKKFGEKEAIEFTIAVAHWSFWAILLNATRP